MRHWKIQKLLVIGWLLITLSATGQKISKPDLAVLKSIHEIKNLDSTDFSDLSFLSKELKGKRIVMLGEFSHGVKEINEMKIRLIKYLHEKLGYKVLVLESDLAAMVAMNAHKSGSMEYGNLIYQGVVGVWYTTEYKEFMKYLKESPNLRLAGIDPQSQTNNTKYYYKRLLSKIDTVAANQWFAAEQFSEIYLRKLRDSVFTHSAEFRLKRDSCIANYKTAAANVSRYTPELMKAGATETLIQFLKKSIENRLIFINYMSDNVHTDRSVRFRIRDSIMAANLEWIASTIYPNEKIIVSAHNYHIARYNEELPVMGSMLPDAINKESYIIGFFGINGSYGNNSGNPVALEPPAANSLRQHLREMKPDYAFIPLNKINNEKSWTNNVTEVEGFVTYSGSKNMLLSKNFDAVIVIKNISVPKYLYK